MPELTEILEAKPEKEVVKDGGSGTDSDEDENDSIPELEDTEAGPATSVEPAGGEQGEKAEIIILKQPRQLCNCSKGSFLNQY